MAIAFRCTRCRARLHVPTRWAGGSVSCPRCETRVVVPAEPRGERAPFESRDVERSLAMLERPAAGASHRPDGDDPPAAPQADLALADRPGRQGVTVPRWAIYAAPVAGVALAALAFACGVWWCRVTGGP